MSRSRRSSSNNNSISNTRKNRKKKNNQIIFFSFISFCVGYYILDYIAAMEKPPLGVTFNILLGCIIMSVAAIIMVYKIRRQYFPKKRKRSNHVFLEDQKDSDSDTN